MLGRNLPLSEVVHDATWLKEPFLGVQGLGTYGDIHIDTLVLTWVCMGFILTSCALIVPAMTNKGAGSERSTIYRDDLSVC